MQKGRLEKQQYKEQLNQTLHVNKSCFTSYFIEDEFCHIQINRNTA
jgi:hypothetical protein